MQLDLLTKHLRHRMDTRIETWRLADENKSKISFQIVTWAFAEAEAFKVALASLIHQISTREFSQIFCNDFTLLMMARQYLKNIFFIFIKK